MTPIPPALQTAWSEQRRWSKAADHFKSSISRWGIAALVLGAFGAICETAAAQANAWNVPPGWGTAFALAGAVALAAVVPIVSSKLGSEAQRSWIYARAVSEALKSEVYRFLAVPDGRERPELIEGLSTRVHQIRIESQELLNLVSVFEPDGKEAPDFTGVAGYAEKRVRGQIESYYQRAARREASKARRYRRLQFWLTVFAAVLGATAAVLGASSQAPVAAWVAVVTTISSSVMAHAAAGRHDFLAISYAATAAELQRLLDSFDATAASADEALAFVNACESVISVQNQTWMGKVPKG